MAGRGLTQEQIARNLGYHPSTFYVKKAQQAEISEAIQRGRAASIEQVSNVAYEKALEGDVPMVRYWLNNMSKGQWREKHDVEVSGEVSHTITVVDAGVTDCGPSFDED